MKSMASKSVAYTTFLVASLSRVELNQNLPNLIDLDAAPASRRT